MSTYTQKHREYYLRNRDKIIAWRKEYEPHWIKTSKGKYSVQRRHAAQRGIEWQFTFDSWMKWWIDSGHWKERGDERGKYCMSRREDKGPYSPENCYCNLFEENNREVYVHNGIDELGRFKGNDL
jgi:hypothetical protein